MQYIRLAAVLCLALLCGPAYATTYYVNSVGGNDSNDGKSLGTPFLTPQHAAGLTNPGDVVSFIGSFGGGSGGVVPLSISRSGSSAGGYITYQSYYNGSNGPRAVFNTTLSSTDNVIQLVAPVSYIIISGLEIAGNNGSISLATAWVNATANPWYTGTVATINSGVFDNIVSPFTINASVTHTAGTTQTIASLTSTDTVVVGDTIYDTTVPASITPGTTVTNISGSGPFTLTTSPASVGTVTSSNVLQFQHTVHHIQYLNNIVHDFPEGGLAINVADYVTISGNTVYNCGWYGPNGGSGISVYASHDVDTTTGYKTFVTGNVMFNNRNIIFNVVQDSQSYTANGTTLSSSNVLHVSTASPATTSIVGEQVFDSTTPASIVPGTVVTGFGTNTITMSNNAAATIASDTILLAFPTDGEGFILDDNKGDLAGLPPYGGRTLVENNVAFNNGNYGVGGTNSSHVDYLYNTSYLNQTTALEANGSILGGNSGELLVGNAADANVFNNILQAATGSNVLLGNFSNTSTVYGYNLGFGGVGTLPGSNNIIANPQFVAPSITPFASAFPTTVPSLTAFELRPGSPAIDAAVATYTRSTTDILGNPGLAGPSYDIGAYESPCSNYGSNVISNPTTLTSTLFQDGQPAGSITPAYMRDLIVTIWCGRAPWAQ